MGNRAREGGFRRRIASAKERGLTLIETALALGIMALVVASLSMMLAENADQLRARAAADKVVEVHEAAKGYVKANFAALLNATAGGPIVIPSGQATAGGPVPAGPAPNLPSLQGGGYLPSSYVDTNGYGQRHSLIVRRIAGQPDKLEALVTTYGGRPIPDRNLGRIATMIGAAGGFMPATNVNAADNGQVVGSYGGWRTLANTWGPAATRPSVGHVAATLAFEDGNLLTDYLYRNDIGIEQANTMNTDIHMGGNDVLDARDVYARDLFATRNVEAGQDVAAGRDLTAGRNLSVTQNGTVGGNLDVMGASDVRQSSRFRQDLDIDRDLNVDRNARIAGEVRGAPRGDSRGHDELLVDGKLKADYLNIDTVVYNSAPGSSNRNLNESSGVRLGDLLPRMVPQYSYRVIEGSAAVVPKPNCPTRAGSDYTRARVMVYRQTESNRAYPYMDLRTQTVPVNGAGSVVGRAYQGPDGRVDVMDSVYAVDNGLSWTIRWDGVDPVPGVPRQAIAQTLCFYG